MDEWTITELQEKMQAGEITARELTRLYLERIEWMDQANPQIGWPGLNAVIEVNPEALEIAGRLDEERAGGKVRGPLHGIPVLIKDNIDTADRMTTAAGSLALDGSIAAQDATVTAKLREAGAVILGKANLSEWANFRSTHPSSGWSSRGGQVRNPYALDRKPERIQLRVCGGSGGEPVRGSGGH